MYGKYYGIGTFESIAELLGLAITHRFWEDEPFDKEKGFDLEEDVWSLVAVDPSNPDDIYGVCAPLMNWQPWVFWGRARDWKFVREAWKPGADLCSVFLE